MCFPKHNGMVSTDMDFGTGSEECYAVSIQDEKL